MDFVALDFETSNSDLSSICQVGMVHFKGGQITETFASLVDPDDYFDRINTSIHGIDAEKVRGAPQFPVIYPEICRRTKDVVVVCHSLFDRAAFYQACARHHLEHIECRWLDTMRVVRRAWAQYAFAGYGLSNLAKDFGIEFNHHDAAEDARATGLILLRALNDTGLSLDDWFVQASHPLSGGNNRVARDGNPDGPLSGEVVVFTGALSMRRAEAADLAATAGCTVDGGITKETTLLVVGDHDVRHFVAGQTKSSKHLKAEALIAKGQPIRILRETDFKQLIGLR